MRSSEGAYFERLDHLRALAVFMVFIWHFVHGGAGIDLLAFASVPVDWAFPLSVVEEGHSGVALFMVLSGYLFTKIVGSRTIIYSRFLFNRALRLLPVLALVMVPYALRGEITPATLVGGFVRGWPPDGSWSIAVEMQFYLLLPLLLAVPRERRLFVWGLLLVGVLATRSVLHVWLGEIKDLSTFSFAGRADNFLVGMMLAELSLRAASPLAQRWIAALVTLAFLVFYHVYNNLGGEKLEGSSWLWVVLPTIESVGFAALIFLYDRSGPVLFEPLARLLAAIGAASYAIYLLHFAIVIGALKLMEAAGLSSDPRPWSIVLLSVPVFGVCCAVGWLAHVFIERPVLKLRVPYLRERPTNDRNAPVAAAV